MKKYSKLISSLLVLIMTVALTACSGDKSEGGSSETPNSDSNISQAEPKDGGDIVVGIQQDLDSLDPHKAVAAGTSEVLFNIFEGLVKPDEEGSLQCAVASEYKISEDGTTYTFTLRDGVKFHNGKLVTTDDVVYSIKRSAGLLDEKDESVRVESALKNIKEVNALDDKTVEVKLEAADTELLGYFTFAIIPSDYNDQAKNPVGTGPFKFVSYKEADSLVMEKNADYWGTKPYLNKVTFKIVSDGDAAIVALQAGSIDIYPYLTVAQSNQLKDTFNIETGNMNLVQGLFLNNAEKPFDNQKVREALNYAVDRQAILEFVAGGKGTPLYTGMFPGLKEYYNQDLSSYYQRDVEKAKALLAEAGYADGLSFTIKAPADYQYHVDTAQVIVQQLAEAGIKAEIKTIDWSTWLSEVYTDRNYQATIVGLDANLAPRDLMERYGSEAHNNFVNFNDKTYDEVLAKALATTKEEEKVTYYKQLQEILTKQSASVYIADPSLVVAVNKKLAGYTFYPVYVQDMSKVYFTK